MSKTGDPCQFMCNACYVYCKYSENGLAGAWVSDGTASFPRFPLTPQSFVTLKDDGALIRRTNLKVTWSHVQILANRHMTK